MDLNLDCQLLILDELDWMSLISMAETNEHFMNIIKDIFRCRFEKKSLILSTPHSDSKIEDHQITETSDSISIQNHQLILKILKNFGSVIPSLRIFHNTTNENSALVYRSINLHCFKTLKQIEILVIQNEFFDEFTKPFKDVQSVRLDGNFKKLSSSKLSLSEMFPVMSHLSLGRIQVDDTDWIVVFPNLVHLKAQIYSIKDINSEYWVEGPTTNVIKTNRHVRSLHLLDVNPKLLKFIADEMPNVENLELQGFEHDLYDCFRKYDIYFKSVIKLKFEISFRKLPRNFSFENLEDLEIVDPDTHDPEWIDFVERNKNLKRVFVSNYRLNGTEFPRFASMKLTDLSVWIGEDVDNETIANFISNNTNLQHFRLNKFSESDEETKDLIKQSIIFFRNSLADWNVQVISNEIIFVRK